MKEIPQFQHIFLIGTVHFSIDYNNFRKKEDGASAFGAEFFFYTNSSTVLWAVSYTHLTLPTKA